MLVLERKSRPSQNQIVIDHNIVVTVLSIDGGRVRLGIAAPPEVPGRGEVVAGERLPSLAIV